MSLEPLELHVKSDGFVVASQRARELTRAGADVESQAKRLGASHDSAALSIRNLSDMATQGYSSVGMLGEAFGALVAPVAAAVGAATSLNKVIEETKEYDGLIARLNGITGGVEEARDAFNELEEISDGTIYTENQVVEAFLRLQQTGLDPSERALKSFANIASATGKSLESLSEVTLSASMGVFRGLKDLGIKAVAEGDRVKMTFKGVTTTIGNSAEEIQEYLVKIGETDFAGAAARQLDTMGGAVKQLGEAWNDLFREVGRSVIGDVIKTSIGDAASVIRGVTAAADALLYTLSKRPKEMSADRKDALNDWIKNALGWGGQEPKTIEERYAALLEAQEKAFTNPQQQKALEAYRARVKEIKGLSLEAMQSGYALDERSMLKNAEAEYRRSAGGIGRDTETKQYEPHVTKMFDVNFAERAKEREAELAALMDRDEKIRQLDERYKQERASIAEEEARIREELDSVYRSQEEDIAASHERRLAKIKKAADDEVITEERKDALIAAERKKADQEYLEFRAQQAQMSLSAAGDIFGAFASIAKKAGGEESKTYRTLFALSKAFAVGQATVAMYTAMASGMAKGWPEGIPLMLSAAAQGAGILANIAGAEYSGAYDRGGTIPAGKVGLVGERRPELVYGPAQVVGSADTARMMSGGFQQSAQQPINLKVVTAPDVAGARQFMTSSEGETTFLALARKHATTIRKMVA